MGTLQGSEKFELQGQAFRRTQFQAHLMAAHTFLFFSYIFQRNLFGTVGSAGYRKFWPKPEGSHGHWAMTFRCATGLRLLCPGWLGHGGYLGPLNIQFLARGIPKSCFNTKSTKSRSHDLDNLKLPHDWTESLVCFHWVTMFRSLSRHLCHLKASRGPRLVPGTPL